MDTDSVDTDLPDWIQSAERNLRGNEETIVVDEQCLKKTNLFKNTVDDIQRIERAVKDAESTISTLRSLIQNLRPMLKVYNLEQKARLKSSKR